MVVEKKTLERIKHLAEKPLDSSLFKKHNGSKTEMRLLSAIGFSLWDDAEWGELGFAYDACYHLYARIFDGKSYRPRSYVGSYYGKARLIPSARLELVEFALISVALACITCLLSSFSHGLPDIFTPLSLAGLVVVVLAWWRKSSLTLHRKITESTVWALMGGELDNLEKSPHFLHFCCQRYMEDRLTRRQRRVLLDYITRHPKFYEFAF